MRLALGLNMMKRKGQGGLEMRFLDRVMYFPSVTMSDRIWIWRPFANIWNYCDGFDIFVSEFSQGMWQKSERITILATSSGWQKTYWRFVWACLWFERKVFLTGFCLSNWSSKRSWNLLDMGSSWQIWEGRLQISLFCQCHVTSSWHRTLPPCLPLFDGLHPSGHDVSLSC